MIEKIISIEINDSIWVSVLILDSGYWMLDAGRYGVQIPRSGDIGMVIGAILYQVRDKHQGFDPSRLSSIIAKNILLVNR